MDVRGAVRMAVDRLQHPADRAIIGDWIETGLDRPEPVAAVRLRGEDAAQVVIGLDALLLHVIEAVVVGLPDIDGCAGDGTTLNIQHPAAYQGRLPLVVQADVGTVLVARRSFDVEGPEDRVRRGAA